MIDRRLQVLRMVAACGTVTGAAEALHYTPSAVSQQLRSLSRDLGVELVVQDGRRIRLTPAARVLVERSDDLFTAWEEVRGDVGAADTGGVGTLRLCGFSTAASSLLPQVALAVRAARPRSRVRIIEADPEECFDLLLADEADVAVVVATAGVPASTDPRFEQHHLLEDPLDLLVATTHRLAGEESVHLGDLAQETWIMDRPGRPYHQLLQAACVAAGFSPAAAHVATEWDTGAALVAAGLGVSLVPRLAHLPADHAVVRIPLRGAPAPSRHILTGVRRGSSRQPLIALALAELAARARAR
ncbi:LysR family transcriptional regulator [Marmoricola sp. Leaf446]|uniref:LysR family transcriptional regulator n=1 Tax=Marmoricola sp. Leaf446 TaxID=1736379 RepID=UPI0006FC69E1|nr:LysR family transcriptional regulator [Marmoricola sp. Leaf446]KQT94736.1 LysR family transcriptional regulator [Marmoricola sp. Leaf446]